MENQKLQNPIEEIKKLVNEHRIPSSITIAKIARIIRQNEDTYLFKIYDLLSTKDEFPVYYDDVCEEYCKMIKEDIVTETRWDTLYKKYKASQTKAIVVK